MSIDIETYLSCQLLALDVLICLRDMDLDPSDIRVFHLRTKPSALSSGTSVAASGLTPMSF